MSAVISQAVAIGRGVAAAYRPDTYELRRVVRTSDDAGGWTETVSTVEVGTAVLVAAPIRPVEQATTDRIRATTPYELRNMRWDSLVTEQDTLIVAGRDFEVIGVRRTAQTNVAVTAICEERH